MQNNATNQEKKEEHHKTKKKNKTTNLIKINHQDNKKISKKLERMH